MRAREPHQGLKDWSDPPQRPALSPRRRRRFGLPLADDIEDEGDTAAFLTAEQRRALSESAIQAASGTSCQLPISRKKPCYAVLRSFRCQWYFNEFSRNTWFCAALGAHIQHFAAPELLAEGV